MKPSKKQIKNKTKQNKANILEEIKEKQRNQGKTIICLLLPDTEP